MTLYEKETMKSLFESIYIRNRIEPLIEKVLRESPTGYSTGGLLGQKAGEICIQEEKPILELLKLSTSKVFMDNEIVPQKEVPKKNITQKKGFFGTKEITEIKQGLINISNIQDQAQRQNAINRWIDDATNRFIETFSKVRLLSQQEKTIVRNYFQNISTQQPRKGQIDSNGQQWN